MSKTLKTCVAAALFAGVHVFTAAAAAASPHGNDAEAQEMVKKAVALVNSAGPESAYKTFTDHPGGAFKDRDLYVFVYDFDGNCLAQGANPKMVGKNLIGLRDFDGNEMIKGQVALVKTKGSGWSGPYKFNNPVTNIVEVKKAYCQRGAGETIVCSGVYSGQ
ncbi:cache domain-containing protein [Ramlibacter sp.]|uniref:cache domain-containing protein n=1 Tax=Ramlibacter sp. TaxID=1917967 RepID=UPI0026172FC8|nr:cache domain-containing protein [Ramlibacter sp.]MDB5958147.1 histidine kinase [Ramlibacter sp.]